MARPYMNKIARRQMLLDTASGIVDEYGWNTLSMISLAEHGGVSRQLVYQNFDSINTLTEQTASYMFEELYTEIQDVLRKHSDDIVVAITKAQHVLFSFPEGRVQADYFTDNEYRYPARGPSRLAVNDVVLGRPATHSRQDH